MTFKDIYKKALILAGEYNFDYADGENILDYVDVQALEIIKDGINQGYLWLATTVEEQFKVGTPIAIADIITLPDDCFKMHSLVHDTWGELCSWDYDIKGKSVVFKTSFTTGTITPRYISFPTMLSDDADIPVIGISYHHMLSLKGAAAWFTAKKQYALADQFNKEFYSFAENAMDNDVLAGVGQ